MANKSFAKLLSVILTLAICATTVFGCLMTTNAQSEPNYVVSEQKMIKGATSGELDVTFTFESGIVCGLFDVDNDGDWYDTDKLEVEVKTATALEGQFDANDFETEISTENSAARVYFKSKSNALYSSVTLTLSFTFTSGIQNDIEVSLSDLDFTDGFEDYTDFSGKNGKFVAGCTHEYKVSGNAVYTDDANGYAVYNTATCVLCGEAKDSYQVVPVADSTTINAVSWTGGHQKELSLLDPNAENSESNPFIIETPAQLYSLQTGNATNNGNAIDTAGKFFKVADGIDAFYMNGGETVANLADVQAVKEYFDTNGGSNWWSNYNGPFMGTFDGNGVIVYGLYGPGDASGIFPYVSGNATIKNVTIKNSYFKNNANGFGAIIGTARGTTESITVENCSVINNYLCLTDGSKNIGASAVAGYCYGTVSLNNIVVHGNIFDNSAYTGTGILRTGLIAYSASQTISVKNVISVGITPWSLDSTWNLYHIDGGNFVNIFTDADMNALYEIGPDQNTTTNAVKYNINGNINPNDLLGANAVTKTKELTAANKAIRDANRWPFPGSDLDWNTAENPNGVWFAGKAGQYPTLLKGFTIGAADTTNPDWNLLGANIEYKNDGSYALNFHFVPAYENQDIELYVAKADTKNGFMKLDTYTTSPFASEFAGAKMFTIDTLSARDIETDWLATIITKSSSGDEIVYGKTESISIATIAKAVINGDAYYDSNASDADKANDVKVAAALINYNSVVKDISNETSEGIVDEWAYDAELGVKYDDQYLVSDRVVGSGSQADPYIISTAEQLASLAAARFKDAGGTVIDTTGLYFKVADGIKAFYMNGGEALANLKTAAEVKAWFDENGSDCSEWWTGNKFKGTFDGNGATVYGVYCAKQAYAGFFHKVDGATIKNLTVANSYFSGTESAGAIAAGVEWVSGGVYGPINLENCAAVNNYITATSAAGVVIGQLREAVLTANNILAAGNQFNFTAKKYGVFGKPDRLTVQNVVAIGVTPWSLDGGWNASHLDGGNYKNAYTDQSLDDLIAYDESRNGETYLNKYNIKKLSISQMTGVAAVTNMPVLDWENVWCYGAEGQAPILVAGLKENVVKTAVRWNINTYDDQFIVNNEGDGTQNNPYIIHTAEQLASVTAARVKDANGSTVDTAGLYFKVADNVGAFYMANDDATYGSPDKWDTLDKVKAALSDKAGVYKWWVSGQFKGHFDGNGAVVYGLFADKEGGALFPYLGGGATIKNITVANSYFAGVTYSGGIAGQVQWYSGIGTNTTTFENCGVVNNYLKGTSSCNAGALIGHNREDKLVVRNCFVADNEIVNSLSDEKSIVGNTWNGSNSVSDSIIIGSTPYCLYANSNGCKVSMFSNVYTDMDLSAGQNKISQTYAANQITTLTTAQMQGENAKTNMPALAWDSVWFVGKDGEYPSFTKASAMSDDMQALYDSITIDTLDNYGDSTSEFGVYSTGLTLKTNPYMTFTFAFNGEYKQNANVVVTFKSNGNTIAMVTAAKMTNNEGAGRYHLYRLKDIPVKALCSGIEVTATYNGKTFNLGTYSVEGFALQAARANRIDPCDYYATRYEAAKALLFYVQMLNARYGA